MHTYVVRVYRLQEDHPRQLIGVVEEPGQGLPLAFSNIDELWAILSVPGTTSPEPASSK